MKPATLIRTDGNFGAIYQELSSNEQPSIRRVIAAYRVRYNVSYRQAWQHWFNWATREHGNQTSNGV